MTWLTGKVDAVAFTHCGNQWTTIDGVKYYTLWDAREVTVKAGVFVQYAPSMRVCWPYGDEPIPYAEVRSE